VDVPTQASVTILCHQSNQNALHSNRAPRCSLRPKGLLCYTTNIARSSLVREIRPLDRFLRWVMNYCVNLFLPPEFETHHSFPSSGGRNTTRLTPQKSNVDSDAVGGVLIYKPPNSSKRTSSKSSPNLMVALKHTRSDAQSIEAGVVYSYQHCISMHAVQSLVFSAWQPL
jgi:hypothetical protein